jgi:N-acetylmuramoyl-L-alanine amidase
LSRYYKEVKDLGVKKAPFYVLVGAHMPCVLVEVSFIDHPVEGRRLISRRYQKLVATAIYEGVREFFASR